MNTKILKISPKKINKKSILYCANLIKKGKLVAFPTETVYGLGADALNPKAIKNIFKAKGRPSDNPLIVHISDLKMLDNIVKEIPSNAKKLIKKFWPGPLTIIFKKKKIIPDSVTCNLSTVAVRMPSHPIANALIKYSETPIAAPSANISGRLSGTTAKHVIEDLSGRIDAIINGGDADIGLESTVIDITSKKPILLRPGGICKEDIEKCLKLKISIAKSNAKKPKSPGMKYRHYSPSTKLIIIKAKSYNLMCKKINLLSKQYIEQNKKICVLGSIQTKKETLLPKTCKFYVTGNRNDFNKLATNLFKMLREIDKKGYDFIIMGACSEQKLGLAIMNRLKKAATEIV
jgi:L-threonylcarbamoyladenylate synthase